ncbi:MAG: sulfurtransferase TusA family protein [Armatimonadetes bacterium]|nr:sulfurtransferase TusA family protein [Armatimonadota bacterium]
MDDQTTVDARGLSCPQPAFMTKKALDAAGSGCVRVLVDNAASRDNVARLVTNAGWRVTVEEDEGGVFCLTCEK